MITYINGDIFSSESECLVNPVNSVGVMGAGLAKAFKSKYPRMFSSYQRICNEGSLYAGMTHVWYNDSLVWGDPDPLLPHGPLDGMWCPDTSLNVIINVATKQHWKDSSTIEYVEYGLQALKRDIERLNIQSVAMPALGCGLGGLDFQIVRPVINEILRDVDCRVSVYIPH